MISENLIIQITLDKKVEERRRQTVSYCLPPNNLWFSKKTKESCLTAPFFYGKFLEYGTSKMTARPFMGPAQAESKKQVLETIRQTLKAGLDL